MTGRINYTPEAEKQLNELDVWITRAASAEIAQRFVLVILDHIGGILLFPLAGTMRDDVRPGMRTSTDKKRTFVAIRWMSRRVSSWSNILGIFHQGQDWEAVLGEAEDPPEAARCTVSCVANAWQESHRRPLATNVRQTRLRRSAAQCQR